MNIRQHMRMRAIDGEIHQDALLQPIARDSEVILINKIAGG